MLREQSSAGSPHVLIDGAGVHQHDASTSGAITTRRRRWCHSRVAEAGASRIERHRVGVAGNGVDGDRHNRRLMTSGSSAWR